MNKVRGIISMALLLAFVTTGLTAQAQRTRVNRYQVTQIISRVQSDTTRFRTDLDYAIRNSRIDNTRRENNINLYITDFVNATAQLRTRNDQRRATVTDARLVLDRATLVDNFLRRNQLEGNVNDDWATVRADLGELATAYGITWNPTPTRGGYGNNGNNGGYGNYPSPNTGVGTAYGVDRMLTGTYRLDVSRSDDPRTAAQNATRSTSVYGRQQSQDALLARLEAPDTLAIERRGTQVTIASTRAPQITLVADGRERVEQLPNGRSVRAKASLYGDQFIVSTSGDRDSDFTVTFDPVENGQRLEVTRRISDLNLRTPVTVRSVYERTSDVAQFDIYRGGGYTAGTTPVPTASGDFIVPDGVSLRATLDQDLSTRTAQQGEQFTMTVTQPNEYAGASLQGHISGVARSGRVTGRSEMSFNFDRIVMRDGRSYTFSGFVEGIRSTTGESVKVDNEGGVRDNSQTNRTVQRTAIGTAVGAIIGAIAGGGSGAAIGAVVGAGAGAGSVYVQGRDDLELLRGSEVTVRSSSPQRR